MKRRLVHAAGIVLLAISVALVVWQGSFHFGGYGPSGATETLILWAISTLNFLLMVTLAFMLGRAGVKLYVERRRGHVGSRIKTKLVLGAVTLSSMPVFFLVLFSYQVLNRNLDKWFSKPSEAAHVSYREIAGALEEQVRQSAELRARLLAASPELGEPGFVERFAREHALAWVEIAGRGSYGSLAPGLVFAQAGRVRVAVRAPVDVAEKQRAIDRYNAYQAGLAARRKDVRQFYLAMMALITLFILFVATWIALFLARLISVPISELAHAAGEVRKGNLDHRVAVEAVDELADLVRNFNQMTAELGANSRELEARRRFTEAILESIPSGVLSVSWDGSIRRANRALGKMFPGDAARLEDLFSREDRAEIKYLMKRARRTGLASGELELDRSGETRHIAVTVSALAEKNDPGFVLVLEDTSELLRAQKAAAWHEVARRIAHEIKNPLTPIVLSAERIARQIDNPKLVAECAAMISRSAESVKTLVDEFSRFARFPAARLARADLNSVVERALAVFEGRLDGIEIRTRLARPLPPVNIDGEQFERVVVNLVDNAAEAMQDSLVRELYVETQLAGPDTVELVIADSGCGVTPEQKEKLFLPYFSTKRRGTGLGLAIVNHILAEHHATIRVEDNQPAGTRFIIEVPAAAEVEAAAV